MTEDKRKGEKKHHHPEINIKLQYPDSNLLPLKIFSIKFCLLLISGIQYDLGENIFWGPADAR